MPAFHIFSSPRGHFSLPVSSVSGRYPEKSIHVSREVKAIARTCKGADVAAGPRRFPDGLWINDSGHGCWNKGSDEPDAEEIRFL